MKPNESLMKANFPGHFIPSLVTITRFNIKKSLAVKATDRTWVNK